ncbi:multidrug resistance-associated ABC transporter [Panaeolus papilionaceus]|nr:multidrug resistance-associated ABC transporter [Panaeolus papilionaceus]
MKFSWFKTTPAPPTFGAGKVLPNKSASFVSRLTIWWLGQFLDVGFSRPLEEDDFWELPPHRLTSVLTDRIETNFYERCAPEKRPAFMRDTIAGESAASVVKEKRAEVDVVDVESQPKEKDSEEANEGEEGKTPEKSPYDESLFKAIHKSFIQRIWYSGALLLISETLKTTTPLVNKVLITWLAESYIYIRLSDSEKAIALAAGFGAPRGIGFGIGLAFALFAMQEVASIMGNHFMLFAQTTGLYVRTGVIGTIFRKSLRLSGKARAEHTIGKITTMISQDATHLDLFSTYAHHLWVAPIELIIGIALLINNLGVSALVGLGVLVVAMPFQGILIAIMYRQRQKGLKITDQRVRLTTEILHGIRLIKTYGWESFYTEKIMELRKGELGTIRASAFAVSGLIAMFTFVPILASILSFIVYALTGHDLNIAVIFTSLQLFNVIRVPLLVFPIVMSTMTDALISLGRISTFLVAEELPGQYKIDRDLPDALQINGDFEWETVYRPPSAKDFEQEDATAIREAYTKEQKEKKEKEKAKKKKKKAASGTDEKAEIGSPTIDASVTEKAPVEKEEKEEKPADKPFGIKGIDIVVPRGSFVAIVGTVGSGKSSLLQAIVGEMRRSRGDVTVGGSVAYVPQSPWIRNDTIRQNILFGQPDDESKFREVIHACGLDHDLKVFSHGEETEIGEKGITLSGGQKARVSLARAAYHDSDIVLLDDPLSAVDAYVGKHILENCLLDGPMANRTRVLVTHALHVLDKVDYIYVMDNGSIIERGTYKELIANGALFARLIEEYGSKETSTKGKTTATVSKTDLEEEKVKKNALMQLEERNTGSVSWQIYARYFENAGGIRWLPLLLFLLVIVEGHNVATTLVLGFWTGNTLPHFSQRAYMALYAGLGAGLAISTFLMTVVVVLLGIVASMNLYRRAFGGVLGSPLSFFDTTPIGRIVSRLSKDQETIDAALPIILQSFVTTLISVFGTIGLVFYTFPYLGIIFAPLAILYYIASVYYRRNSVETKRLDSLLRSALYASYSESLTGLTTIRAYRQQTRSIKHAEHGLDMENRAYMMTITMQRWLAMRLEFFGNILILGIALFGAGLRGSVNPAKISVVLTYTLTVTMMFSELISMFAQTEQNMNSVERVLHYAELDPEEKEGKAEPPSSWPERGAVSFRNVKLAYREGLPLVLKGVSFDVRPAEKIGIVGRTGSGKSTLIQALMRLVELQEGIIEIDNVNTAEVPLHTLRSRMALVPQDNSLFLGTLRENLDPQHSQTDSELIAVLQRASLLPKDGPIDPTVEAKFSLDAVVSDEGSNYSAGEKQLLALCRALVKNSRIIILDEATSNVDVETDSKVQRTIQTEFASSTLLCIAHRLNTIAHYDRVLVMDDGQVAELDTVLNLFDNPSSIFRSLCDEANLTRNDILKIRQEHGIN